MAIKKDIILDNGVAVTYHRITSLNKITNMCNNIEISSYVNEQGRQLEKEYQQLQLKSVKSNGENLTEKEKEQLEKGINVFINTDFINIPYNEKMTIQDAYNYLLTLNNYKNGTLI